MNRDLLRRVRNLEPRGPRPAGRIRIVRVRPGQTEAEALEQDAAEKGYSVDSVGHCIFIVRDDGRRRPDPGERDSLPVPIAAAAS